MRDKKEQKKLDTMTIKEKIKRTSVIAMRKR
jgi:hypothetical protein